MLYDFSNLNKTIDSKCRDRIIKKIFDGDRDEYGKFIDNLQSIESWEDAYRFIDYEFTKRNISINGNRLAADFTDIVFKKYFPIYNF